MSINADHSKGTIMKKPLSFCDIFANHSAADGRPVTGQNRNAGAVAANKMMIAAKGGLK